MFELDDKAVNELYEIVASVERADASRASLTKFMQSFDDDDYGTAKRNRNRDIGGPPIEYFLGRHQMDPRLVSEVVKVFNSSESYEAFSNAITQLSNAAEESKQGLSQRPINAAIKTFTGEEHTVPRYVKQLLSRIKGTKILHFKERRVPIGSEEAKRLLSLKTRRGGTEVLVRIQSTIDELLGVKVDAFEGPVARGQSVAELDVDDFLIQVNGSGIREALRLILDTEFENPDILLVEEPEIHLHPALETSIMSYLREVSRGIQVFITTHSTNFLDTGNFQNVFLVLKNGSTSVAPLTLAEAADKLPSELGIRLSSLFMYDQIIFVEGPSDEQIIREIARTLNVNLGQLNVGFIQLRGVRNLGHYAAAEVVSFLTRRQVKLHFLIDADEANSVHFARLRDEFGDNARIQILKRREIENYLLSPAANIRHLASRTRSTNNRPFAAPTEETFRSQEEEAAEGLKHLAIWKRVMSLTCRPLYPADQDRGVPEDMDSAVMRATTILTRMRDLADATISEVKEVYEKAADAVEREWPTSKMDIVPGSAILDEVYKRYGFRYDKMRDGIGVAAQMEESEIDRELRDFIHVLGKPSP